MCAGPGVSGQADSVNCKGGRPKGERRKKKRKKENEEAKSRKWEENRSGTFLRSQPTLICYVLCSVSLFFFLSSFLSSSFYGTGYGIPAQRTSISRCRTLITPGRRQPCSSFEIPNPTLVTATFQLLLPSTLHTCTLEQPTLHYLRAVPSHPQNPSDHRKGKEKKGKEKGTSQSVKSSLRERKEKERTPDAIPRSA